VTPEEQERFEALERRVAELERRLPKQWKIPAVRAVPKTPTDPVAPAVPVAPLPQGQIRRRELNLGLNWISRIAVLTVALAMAFFFQYAFENRLISESGRVGLGLAFGVAAFAAGEYFFRKSQRVYGQSLAAVGAAFFYLSIWAAFGLYHLLPQSAAFVLMILTTAVGGFLAFRYDSPAVALLGLSGGYATPLLLRGGDQPWFVLSYALVLSAGAAGAARAKGWRLPEPLAIIGTAVLYVSQIPARPLFALFVVAYFALFAASRSVVVFVAAQVLAAIALATIWAPGEIGLAAALAISAGGLVIRPAAAPGSFAGFWLAYAFWYGKSGHTPLGVLTAAFLIFLGWPIWRRTRLGAVSLITLPLNAGLYFGASYSLLTESYGSYVGLFAVGVASAQAAAAGVFWRIDQRTALLSAGTAWVILILAAPIQFVGSRVTVIWAAEAAAMAWIGVRLAERRAVHAAIALLGVVLVRLAVSDARAFATAGAGAYTTLINARFLAFTSSAIAFWAVAWWIREGRLAAITYAIGHAVMLWGFVLEAIGWAARTASPENFTSVASTAISVMSAGYALMLVGGGAAWKHAVSRLMGIGLIGIVVLKLYLYDVWLLGAFYRMAAFAILGVMLLVMSYLYSRRASRGPAPREP
jgi:uncharacterized membrane protein